MSTKDLNIDTKKLTAKINRALAIRDSIYVSKQDSGQDCPYCGTSTRVTGDNWDMRCYGGNPIEVKLGYTYTCYNSECEKYRHLDAFYDECLKEDFTLKEMY